MSRPPGPDLPAPAKAWLDGYRAGLGEVVVQSPRLRATFAPHDRSGPIMPVDVTADRTTAEIEIMAHLQWEARRGPIDVTIRRDLSSGVVWVGPYCADQGWLITLERVS